ncbi:MAG: MFS transporter [Armatimonadota bacterium]|jgi:MFS family permease
MGKHGLPTDPAPFESEAAATVKQEAQHPGWRATLYTMWVAQMLAMVGFAFVMPFIPFYIRQLGVTNARMVPIWAGLAVTGVTSAVASIVVGRCSDRWGHKPMLVACVGLAGVMCLPQAIVHSVTQLLVVRAIFGMGAGDERHDGFDGAATSPGTGLWHDHGGLVHRLGDRVCAGRVGSFGFRPAGPFCDDRRSAHRHGGDRAGASSRQK